MNKMLLFLIIPVLGFAADRKDAKKFYDEVTAVSASSISLYRSPTKEAKFTVTKDTKVIADYKPAKIEDVKVGMRASVAHKPDSDEATSINARTIKPQYK